MKEKNKTILIAVSFIMAFVLFIWGVNFLKGKSLLRNQLTFYAIYDNSRGLLPGDIVTVNGMAIGNVNTLEFHPSQDGSIIVRFTVNKDIVIPEDTEVKLASHLTGSVNLDLKLGSSNIPAQSGDTLKSSFDAGTMGMITEQLLPLKDKLETLMVSLNTLSNNINDLLSPELKKDINNGIDDLASTMNNVKHITADIKEFVDPDDGKLNTLVNNLEDITTNFSAVSDSLSKIDYAHLVNSLENCVADFNTLIDGINKGEGSAGLLVKDDQLYENINAAVSTLQQLLDEIKKNPKKLKISVF